MKRLLLVVIAMVVIGLTPVACTNTTPPPAPTAPSPTPAPVPTPKETFELSFAHFVPPQADLIADIAKPWADEVEKRTNGRVKIKFYPSGTLGTVKEMYDAVLGGTANISATHTGLLPGRFELMKVTELPFIIPDAGYSASVQTDLIRKFPQMLAQANDTKFLWAMATPPATLHTKKPITNLADLKGVKILAGGGIKAEALGSLGAIAIVKPMDEAYTAIETGLADGVLTPWGGVTDWKLEERLKYHLADWGFGSSVLFHPMNLDVWKKLPADIQKIIDDIDSDYVISISDKGLSKSQVDAINKIKNSGGVLTKLTADEAAIWREQGKPIHQKWISQREAAGEPGKNVVEEALRLVAKYYR